MAIQRRLREVSIGRRVDGSPWTLRFVELGSGPGPSTAVIGGMYGDKAMVCLSVLEVERRLLEGNDLAGRVLLSSAINLPALENTTRVNPDSHSINSRFPGSQRGFLTDQFAHQISQALFSNVDCVLDLHSGTPTMALWYTYEFGDLELAASFGYLPVSLGHRPSGQLCALAAERGIGSLLPEFGGGPITDLTAGVEGSLNVLRYRGHIGGKPTGPATVPIIGDRDLKLISTSGALELAVDPSRVGRALDRGILGWVTNVATGERMEEFMIGRDDGILMMARTGPAMVSPGEYAFMVGYPSDEVDVPGH